MNKIFVTIMLLSVSLIFYGCDTSDKTNADNSITAKLHTEKCVNDWKFINHEWRLIISETTRLYMLISRIPFQKSITDGLNNFIDDTSNRISKNKSYQCETIIDEWSEIAFTWNKISILAEAYTNNFKSVTNAIRLGSITLQFPYGLVLGELLNTQVKEFHTIASYAKERVDKANNIISSIYENKGIQN